MTAPRAIVPGRTYLVTRRCTQRQYLLTPSAITNSIIAYSLALAAHQTGVRLHAYCFMSNHWHGVVNDPEGRLPEFLERFHRLVARAQNVALGRRENFWSSEKPSAVWLVAETDVVDAIAYTIANPTAAGLVSSPSEWPGLITERVGEAIVVEKPTVFFATVSDLPSRLELRTHEIVQRSTETTRGIRRRLGLAVRSALQLARAAMVLQGRSFVGAATIVRQSPSRTPTQLEVRRSSHPQIAAQVSDQRRDALGQARRFITAYRLALERWRAGVRDVLFPAGTYALRVNARVACEPYVALSA